MTKRLKTIKIQCILLLWLIFCVVESRPSSVERNLAYLKIYGVSGIIPYFPKIFSLANGQFVVAYHTSENKSYISFNTSSSTLGNFLKCSNCTFPSVAQSSLGEIAMIYYSISDNTIKIETFNSSALTITFNFSYNLVSQTSITWTSADSSPLGKFAFCWVTNTGDIYIVVTNNTLVNSSGIITYPTNYSTTKANINLLSNENLITVWNTDLINAIIYNDSGNIVLNSFVVNSTTTAKSYNPSVASLSNSKFVIVWDTEQTGKISIFGKIYSNDGAPISTSEFKVTTLDNNIMHYPVVSETLFSQFVIMWQDFIYTNSDFDIYFREYDFMGLPTSAVNLVTGLRNGAQNYPAIAYHPTLRYVFSYISNNIDVYTILASDVRPNPICNSFTSIARPGELSNIDFTLSVDSEWDRMHLLNIKLKSLPSSGVLKQISTGANMIIDAEYSIFDFQFSLATTTPVNFNFIVVDSKRNFSDMCSVTIQTCYFKCSTCNGIGNASNMMCTSCMTLHNLSGSNCIYQGSTSVGTYTYSYRERKCFILCWWEDRTETRNCISNCKSCSNGTSCNICHFPYYLWKGTCYSSCAAGTYPYNGNSCYDCPTGCYTCNSQKCLSCYSSYYLYPSGYDSCISSTPTGYFLNQSTWQYESSSFGCKYGNNANDCSTCNSGYYLNNSDKRCYEKCPLGTYISSTSCLSCLSGCKICTNNSACTTCYDNYIIHFSNKICYLTCPTGSFKDTSDNTCKYCPSNCQICTDSNTCTKCNTNYFLHLLDNKCYISCPTGYYNNTTIYQCILCPSNCIQCPNTTTCTSCATNYFIHNLVDNLCYSTCPFQYFGNITTKKCEACPANCKSCSSATICISCNSNYYLLASDKKCYSQCPDGFFNNSIDGTCTNCSANCKKCDDANNCTMCNINFFLHLVDKKCYNSCPSNYFNNSANFQCGSCPSNCSQCSDSNTCTSCETNYFVHNLVDNQCYSPCPFQYFGNTLTRKCEPCSSNCKLCSSGSVCLTCNTNYYLLASDKKCYSPCPFEFYADTSDGTCKACPTNCKTCTNGDTCTLCNTNFFLHLVDNKCYNPCPVSYFNNATTSKCGSCPSNCSQCSDSNTCTSCETNYFVHNLVDNQCYSPCPFQYFGNTLTRKCEPCSSNCKLCSSGSVCLTCNTNYYLLASDKKCYSPCPFEFYADTSDGTCKACPTNCKTCTNGDTCTVCNPTYFLHIIDNKCYKPCPSRFFNNLSNNQCTSCPQNCLACPSSSSCTTCDTSYFLHNLVNNLCYKPCPFEYFGNSITKKCEPCSTNCKSCTSGTVCIICNSNYYLFAADKKCYSKCPDGFYADTSNGTCKVCPPNCKACTDGDTCTLCNPNYNLFLSDNKCYSICPESYFNDISVYPAICSSCSENCLECLDGATCIKCASYYFLHNLIDSLCYKVCPFNYFGNTVTNNCEECSPNCKLCENSEICTTCVQGYYLYLDKKCYQLCPNGFYENTSLGTCEKCPNNCKKCQDQSNCSTCNEDYFLHLLDNQCYKPCPIGYYGNTITNQCHSCSSNCLYCENEDICTKCDDDSYLHYLGNKKCLSICPDEYYENKSLGTCEICSNYCKDCVDEKICRECNNDFFLFNNFCYPECPNSYFKDAISKTCTSCPSLCLRCVDPINCINCLPGYFLMNSDKKCYPQCPLGYMNSVSSGKCEGCSPNCNVCISPTECVTCAENSYLFTNDKLCYKTCPDRFYGNDQLKRCDSCISNCKICENSSECKECEDSFYLNPLDSTCQESCPDFYFTNKERKLCIPCLSNCFKCENARECMTCDKDYFLLLQTNQCDKTCPDRYYPDSSSGLCNKCDEECRTCSGPLEKDCIECIPPKTKIGNKCLKNCQLGEVLIPITEECLSLDKFISVFNIQGPSEIDIEVVNDFDIEVTLERNPQFLNIPLKIQLLWTNLFGGELFNSNKTLTVYPSNLLQGIYTFTANLVISEIPIKTIKKEVNFRTFKLIAIVNNITELQMEQPIFLDASQSYDERDSGSESTISEEMQYQWICPGDLNRKCVDLNSQIFMLNYDDYKGYVEKNGLSFDVTLNLSRAGKKGNSTYPITLSPKKETVDENFWFISQNTKGIYDEDIIFEVVLLKTTNNFQLSDFSYYWTIPNFNQNNYLNTRKEAYLRVRFSDINDKIESIKAELTNLSTQQFFTKTFQYKSIALPQGKCVLDPAIGFSGETKFRITASDWASVNQPLKYSFFYKNSFDVKFLIKQFYDTSFESLLPYGTDFFLEVTDSLGYVGKAKCNIIIKKKPNLVNLSGNFLSLEDKFLEYEIYRSNMLESYSTEYPFFKFKDSLSYISDLYVNNRNTIISNNIDRIISYINIINSFEEQLKIQENAESFNDLLELISNNSDLFAKSFDLVNSYAKVLDKNFYRYYIDGEKLKDVKVMKQNEEIWMKILNSFYSTLISGQDVAFDTDVNRITISKISKINPSSIKLMTTNDVGQYIVRITPKYANGNTEAQSMDSSISDCNYAVEADVCVEKSEIEDKFGYYNETDIGIIIKVNDLPSIPQHSSDSHIFSSNSIKVSLMTEDITVQLSRRLTEGNSTEVINTIKGLKYKSYLNLNTNMGETKFKQQIQGTTCVVYDETFIPNSTACKSWYDYTAKIVLCDCSVPGLVANLYDLNLTSISKVSQFKSEGKSILNKYSIGIVLSLIFIVFSLYFLGKTLDKSQGYTRKHKVRKYYDLGQSLVIEYTKLGFHKTYGLFKLFIYMVKMTHPLLSIFFIYSPLYGRGLRVLDLYITIKITFLFTMLPYYMTDNSDFSEVKNKRSVADMNKSPGDLDVALKRIAMSLIYSISGTIVSKLITGFLNAIYYQNILENESNEKNKYMLKTLKSVYQDDVFVYSHRCRKAFFKLKTLLAFMQMYKNFVDKKNKKSSKLKSPVKNSPLNMSRKSKILYNTGNDSEIMSLVVFHLNDLNKNKILNNSNFNDILSPQPIYDVGNTEEISQLELFNIDRILKISKAESFNYFGIRRKSMNKIKKFITNISEYGYFVGANKKKKFVNITVMQILDKEWISAEARALKKRSSLKAKLFLFIFISSYILLIIMVTDVYNKYEDNIFKICITPLLSVVISKFLITQNVMIFVHSVFMYKFGEKFYSDNRKTLNPLSLVFKFVIPPISKSNHKALLTFRKFAQISSR